MRSRWHVSFGVRISFIPKSTRSRMNKQMFVEIFGSLYDVNQAASLCIPTEERKKLRMYNEFNMYLLGSSRKIQRENRTENNNQLVCTMLTYEAINILKKTTPLLIAYNDIPGIWNAYYSSFVTWYLPKFHLILVITLIGMWTPNESVQALKMRSFPRIVHTILNRLSLISFD